MEKNTTVSLPEIEAEVKQLKQRISELEEKIAAYVALESSSAPADFTDIELSVDDLPDNVDDLPAAPVEEDLPEVPAEAPSPAEPAPEPAAEPAAEKPRKVVRKPAAKPAAPEKPAETPAPKDYPWLRDVPPVRVKNIRSAISLQDRALYINTLFKEDFQLYDLTISELNALEDATQAAGYITEHFPDWNLKSDIVYSFMMAVRKKLG